MAHEHKNSSNISTKQSGINVNKRKRCDKILEVQPFTIINQNTESFLKSQREALVNLQREIEVKILSLDDKLAKFAKPVPQSTNTSLAETNEISNSNTTPSTDTRPSSPPLHWSTLQVLNQFF